MARQKNVNFELIRENANLKSQLEALHNRIGGTNIGTEFTPKQPLQTLQIIENKDTERKTECDNSKSFSLKEMRDIKDENFRLKADSTKNRYIKSNN